MIHPSPAIIIRADCSINECIALMKEKEVGSVLVVSDDEKERLIGIFTERDLVQKCLSIESGKFWRRPVRTVMTHPVITIALDDLDSAAQLMLDKKVRHLPVVMEVGEDPERLVGLVSIRDVLRAKLEVERQLRKGQALQAQVSSKEKGPQVQIFSKNADFFQFISHVLKVLKKNAHSSRTENLDEFFDQKVIGKLILLVDLDGYQPEDLKAFFVARSALVGKNPGVITVICYTPQKIGEKISALLGQFKSSEKLGVFQKPVNVLAFSNFLSDVLN